MRGAEPAVQLDDDGARERRPTLRLVAVELGGALDRVDGVDLGARERPARPAGELA